MQSHLHHFSTIDSTQDFAKQNVASFDPQALTIIQSDEQTKGRGRFQRHWHSPKGTCLAITYCFHLPHMKHSHSPITLVLALSIAETLQKLGLRPQIKWPNDLYHRGKKLGGILAEVYPLEEGYQVFLGYGLNVNLSADLINSWECNATSLYIETHKKWVLSTLSNSIEILFKRDLKIFIDQGFDPFHQSFEEISFFKGKSIRLDLGKQVVLGKYEKITPEGLLVLKLACGTSQSYASGEIIDWE